MFIELTEALCCPRGHEESYLECVPVTMDGRSVVRGAIGCPRCGAEYPIVDGVAHFAPPGEVPSWAAGRAGGGPLTADVLLTLLDLQGTGGYVLLLGAVGRLGPALAAALPGVHVCGVNPPPGIASSDGFSILRSPRSLPVRRHSMRAAVIGADAAVEPWLSAAAERVLPGLRVVVEDDTVPVTGIEELARGAGVLVGERRAR